MAQITGTVSGGLVIEQVDDAETRADDLSAVEELLVQALRNVRLGQHKAASDAMVHAVNMHAKEHDLPARAGA